MDFSDFRIWHPCFLVVEAWVIKYSLLLIFITFLGILLFCTLTHIIAESFVLDVTFLFIDIFFQNLAEREIFWCSLMLYPWIYGFRIHYMVDQICDLGPGNMTKFLVSRASQARRLNCNLYKKFYMHMVRFFLLFTMVPLSY